MKKGNISTGCIKSTHTSTISNPFRPNPILAPCFDGKNCYSLLAANHLDVFHGRLLHK